MHASMSACFYNYVYLFTHVRKSVCPYKLNYVCVSVVFIFYGTKSCTFCFREHATESCEVIENSTLFHSLRYARATYAVHQEAWQARVRKRGT